MQKLILALSTLLLFGCASWNRDQEKGQLYLRMGNAFIEEGNYPNAVSALLQAEKFDPKEPTIQNALGQVYFLRERYDLAANKFQKAIELMPTYSDARNNLGRTLLELGKYKEAEKEIKIVLDDLTYGGVDKAYINLGLIYFNQKEWEKSQNVFLKILKSHPDDCVANSFYARGFFEQQNYSRAAESLDRAIGFCQKSLYDEPHFYSALAYYRLGDKPKSIARFEELLKYYPQGKYREKAKGMLDLIRKGH